MRALRGSVRLAITHTRQTRTDNIGERLRALLSRGLMTGKRSVLLSLSRLCGRVCIILLIAAGFVEHQLRVVHHGLLFTPNSEAETGVLSSAPVLFAQAGKANPAPPPASPPSCAPRPPTPHLTAKPTPTPLP